MRELAGSTRMAAEAAAAAGCEVAQTVKSLGHDRPLPTVVDASLYRFETVWCAAGTPYAVFRVRIEQLLAALPSARMTAEPFV